MKLNLTDLLHYRGAILNNEIHLNKEKGTPKFGQYNKILEGQVVGRSIGSLLPDASNKIYQFATILVKPLLILCFTASFLGECRQQSYISISFQFLGSYGLLGFWVSMSFVVSGGLGCLGVSFVKQDDGQNLILKEFQSSTAVRTKLGIEFSYADTLMMKRMIVEDTNIGLLL